MNKLQVASLLMIPVMFGLVVAPAGVAASTASYLEYLQAIWAAQAATYKYHDIDNAIADDYEPLLDCLEFGADDPEIGGGNPAGSMVQHYINYDLAGDFEQTETQPDHLLYLPTDTGLRLVGVEYVEVALAKTDEGPQLWFEEDPPPQGFVNEAPSLFGGQTFVGPMVGHGPGIPWHYELHVWLWSPNPAGLFAQVNPALSCP